MRCVFHVHGKGCEEESGDSFLCDGHRRTESAAALDRIWSTVRDIILAIAETPHHTFVCYHCGLDFEREQICVDHFPRGRRGVHCSEMWTITNMVASCQQCNTSGSPHRSRSLKRKTLRPLQEDFVEKRDALATSIEELFETRRGLLERGVKVPLIHEHIELVAQSLAGTAAFSR